jgi:hypothetical protein
MTKPSRITLLPAALLMMPVLMTMGCTGGHRSGDHAGTINQTMILQPATPTLFAGQSLQFTASTPWGKEATWSVLPATAGVISGSGLFTASTTPGACTVYAMWSKDVRYAASTAVTILPLPAAAVITPGLVQASGAPQTVPGTGLANSPILGEPVPATAATNASQTVKARHGFNPSSK